ncbi:threonine-phosphate decarboxylase [Xenorhabdus nematophila]|uniref:threonine-phosphate decarboxylase CobD n=1 Tax=Xenorhabdus nematophila TaxID=628 RepID=UPI0003275656|nr:threonine-phosphate decarboxylase CobD [Xenorhabdus nematophila]CEF30772.1 Threonine-phosphate decarboxylase (L-threonine-O-3-phosphate decarboxylase) [Xenorhabdus nematophila str. Websteri]AYA40824.1 threonine-phosphate decarboxylase [Xenorhabdus nematophila]KHD28619.1 threonine-phosphate decarboxylase [Xenorhabdus nematophila]MBA0019576.1 threonine-phosphate decarboxylase [Xenorhabdus nematophila]MCB4423932.1 threonine-phosphate decarboxylase [Xenorhabdus nematophila]
MSEHGGNIIEVAEKYGLSAHELIDFSANINPLGVPEQAKALIKNHLVCIEKYPDVEYRHLHQAIAKAHQCDETSVIAGNGATELIYAVVRYLSPKRALLLIPGFAEYRRALQQIGAEIVEYTLTADAGFQPDMRLFDTLPRAQPDCIFIATPNNPTGLIPAPRFLQSLAEYCEEKKISLIVDEAFIDFLPDNRGMIPQISANQHLYILRSMTKFFAIPGLRLGYLISGNKAGIAEMKKRREPWSVNTFAALVGEVLLDDHAYIAATHQWLESQQHYLWTHLSAFPELTVWPPSANFLFFRCNKPDLDLWHTLLKHQIMIRHCQNYAGLDERYYRIAVRSEWENQRLIDTMRYVFSHG